RSGDADQRRRPATRIRGIMTDISRLTATELSAAYAAGDTDPVEATRAALDAIESSDSQVNAVVWSDPSAALAEAAESTARWRAGDQRGRADGIPTTIKDLFWTHGVP